jgi:DNA replication protein DnaC
MALDGKILARARSRLEKKRRQKDERFEKRLEQVYAGSLRIREIDSELRLTMSELIGVALGAENASLIEDIRKRNISLQEERSGELVKAGFDASYLNEEYLCPKCKDTGYINAKMCSCLTELYKEEQRVSLSSLFKLGEETFDNFDLSFYDDNPAPDTGLSPRQSMEVVYETCVEYARKFGSKSINLFFNGAPGLGKTFLSACIARVVAENGYSVVYDMAAPMFTIFEDAKFSRTANLEETRDEIKRHMECDLLIIDDLGTEMTTAFTISALYEIINTRLVTARKTLVSSNLTMDELRRRYSEQIMSRLEGEYQVLTFYGDDIRKKKNAL